MAISYTNTTLCILLAAEWKKIETHQFNSLCNQHDGNSQQSSKTSYSSTSDRRVKSQQVNLQLSTIFLTGVVTTSISKCSFNLQGNASSFKHSQQFLRKNRFRKVKHYMQHILSSSINSYISLGIKCISPMTTAYHPCLIQLVHSTLFIHMNIFAKFQYNIHNIHWS